LKPHADYPKEPLQRTAASHVSDSGKDHWAHFLDFAHLLALLLLRWRWLS